MAQKRLTGIPIEAQYLYNQALHHKENGNKEEALKYLTMAVFIAPHFCKAYNAMGNCLDEMGQYEEAIIKYGKVMELNPEHTTAQFKRAVVQKKIMSREEVPLFMGLTSLVCST